VVTQTILADAVHVAACGRTSDRSPHADPARGSRTTTSGSGQERPASPSREKASETVEFETPIARAMARCESPASNLRRKISLILRMDSLL